MSHDDQVKPMEAESKPENTAVQDVVAADPSLEGTATLVQAVLNTQVPNESAASLAREKALQSAAESISRYKTQDSFWGRFTEAIKNFLRRQ